MTADKGRTLISLFTGAGGLDIGLEMAGFRTIAAVDSDLSCTTTLRTNQAAKIPNPFSKDHFFLEGAQVVNARVENLDAADLWPEGGQGRVPDLLAGGPPCQPFSSAGKMRSLEDPRGRLFEDFVRLAKALRPRLILFENVRGLVTARGPSGEPGEALLLTKYAFESIGYATNFALINAADYGVPQRRVRLFMMATRETCLPEFPQPTHTEEPAHDFFVERAAWVTLGAFLKLQPDPDEVDIVRPSRELALLLENIPEGFGLRSPGARERTRPGGHWGYKQGTFIADQNKPARTITAASTQDWIRLKDGTLRRLTWRECARLQGFPSKWQFPGPNATRLRLIGNAVPAQLGHVLGHALLRALQAPKSRRSRPQSAPLPAEFLDAIQYTRREQVSNGPSRQIVAQVLKKGIVDVHSVKGLGSQEFAGDKSPSR